ncbi:MAG TPA: PAS domain-containing protein, partial [Spirochaetia bacterium]|nr:PAS domain-containing protein [Spirochaetia bacterium]
MPNENPGRYAFEHAAVAIFVQDISGVRSRLARLSASRDFMMREYLAVHPEFLAEAIASINLLDVNQASVRLFEAESKDQLIGTLDKVLRDATPAAVAESIVAVYEGRTHVEVESTALTVKGRRLQLLVEIYVPPPAAAEAPSIISLIDITARKEAEERERRSAILLRRIIDSIPDSVFVKDMSLRMVLCNTALAHSIGKEPEALFGKTDMENGWSRDLVKGDPRRGTAGWEKDDRAALSGRMIRVNDELSEVGGDLRYYDTIKVPLRGEGGAVEGLIGVGRDVTERRRLEKELAREHSLFALLMNHLPSQIYFKDKDSRYLRSSRSHAQALG